MKYHSTRNNSETFSSTEAIINGISKDGGLFVPCSFPTLDVNSLLLKPYRYIAARVLSLFLTDYDKTFIEQLVDEVYSEKIFNNSAGHMHRASERLSFLELWHGPTFAFKDYALQVLPKLLCEAKRIQNDTSKSLILVATSGDTGSAALYGFADVPGTEIAVIYPNGGVSLVQEHQMLNAHGENICVYAANGNFDEIQNAVKAIFNDDNISQTASRNNIKLSSANSINLGRLIPQICYYFSSYAELLSDGVITQGEKVDYAVPTGNFGDILAGYYAKKMGLPIGKLVCAANKNRVLADFFETGVYDINREFFLTGSPSMDILVSSNLERLLYHETNDDLYVKSLMNDLKNTGRFEISKELLLKLQDLFFSSSATDEQAQKTILNAEGKYHYICDPHTAVALSVANEWSLNEKASRQLIVLSTANPYKFPSEIQYALSNIRLNDAMCLNILEKSYPWFPVPKKILEVCSNKDNNVKVIDVQCLKDTVLKLLERD